MRRVLLGLVFGLAASCAYAQTAPSPADVGISKGSPDIFKLKGHDNAWTPFGSVDPSTHIFIPGTNGAIAPNDCIKWGPGLTSAGAACNSVTGGAHPANQLTIYTNHAGLVANVTTPTEAWTVVQQGFYAPGDGGDAVYQWSLTSYCVGGTSSAPTPADGIGCVLPIGQDPLIAGRYLLSLSGSLDVRQVGMQSGGFDNYPIVQTLFNVLSPLSGNEGTMEIVIPAILGQRHTYYYFSKPFDLSRNINLNCKGSNDAGDMPVVLVFPPGVDGIIQDAGYFSESPGWGQSTVRSCEITSLGAASGAQTTTGSNVITNAVLNQSAAGMAMPASCNPNGTSCTIGAGDGVIIMGQWIPVGLAVAPGAYVATSDPAHNTFTLASPYTIGPLTGGNVNVEVWDLPASQKYTIQTTIGSNSMIVTAGPKPLGEGDMLWSDAFLFGASVAAVSSATFPQTIEVDDITIFHAANALVGHTSGSPGQMWTVPVGMKRRVVASSYSNVVQYFGIGLDLACQITNGIGTAGCDNTFDQHNYYWFNLVGRLTRGDNTTNSTVIGNVGVHNTIADTAELGSLGSTYISEEYNSQDGGSSSYGILVWCGAQNFSPIIGMYLSGQEHGPCIGADAQGNPSINVAAADGVAPTQLFIGSTYGFGAIASQSFTGNWQFSGANGAITTANTTSPAGQNVIGGGLTGALQTFYRGMYITDLTNPVIPDGTQVTDFTTAGVVLSNNLTGMVQVGDQIQFVNSASRGGPCVSIFPGQNVTGGMFFSNACTTNGLSITMDGINGSWNVNSLQFPGSNYLGYTVGGNDLIVSPDGLVMGSQQAYLGEQRLLDSGTSPTLDTYHLQGDIRLNQVPVSGGGMAWVNAEVARTTLSAALVSGTTTSVAVAACPNPALPAGTPVDWVAPGPDNHSVRLNAYLGTLNDCTGTTLTFRAASLHNAAIGDTIQFLQWHPAAKIANDPSGTNWPVATATYAASLIPCNGGAVGFGVVVDGEAIGSKGYGTAVAGGGGSTRPVFCDGTSWTYH